jgi:hypothetical protein
MVDLWVGACCIQICGNASRTKEQPLSSLKSFGQTATTLFEAVIPSDILCQFFFWLSHIFKPFQADICHLDTNLLRVEAKR